MAHIRKHPKNKHGANEKEQREPWKGVLLSLRARVLRFPFDAHGS